MTASVCSTLILKEQCTGTCILLVAYSTCESWCCHIWSQCKKTLLRYYEKAVSTTIEGTT